MDEKFMMYDESGNEKELKIIGEVELNNQVYLIYSIDENDFEDGIYVSKIIKNSLGNEVIVSILDEDERSLVFDAIRNLINNV